VPHFHALYRESPRGSRQILTDTHSENFISFYRVTSKDSIHETQYMKSDVTFNNWFGWSLLLVLQANILIQTKI
jgi:hypothetical protein